MIMLGYRPNRKKRRAGDSVARLYWSAQSRLRAAVAATVSWQSAQAPCRSRV